MDKDKSLLNGKGEDDISWITVNGAHIPIRDGEDKAAVINEHFDKPKDSAEKKDAVKHLNTPLNKSELVKKIRNFEPIRLNIGDKEIIAKFDKDGAKKIIYGKSESKDKFETQRDHKVKLKNIDRLPEIIKTSKYESSSLEDGKLIKTHQGVKEWHYFVNKVDINNKKYDTYIDVRDKGQNQYVYFVRFKEIKQ